MQKSKHLNSHSHSWFAYRPFGGGGWQGISLFLDNFFFFFLGGRYLSNLCPQKVCHRLRLVHFCTGLKMHRWSSDPRDVGSALLINKWSLSLIKDPVSTSVLLYIYCYSMKNLLVTNKIQNKWRQKRRLFCKYACSLAAMLIE